jgi:putative protease
MENASKANKQMFVGEMISVDKEKGTIDVEVKNRFSVGDRLELIMPDGNNREIVLDAMESLKGEAMEVAPGSGHQVRIPVTGVDFDKMLISRYV